MLPKAILLDLDDTILAFSGSADACWQEVCQRFAPQIDSLTPETMFKAIEKSRNWFWQDSERHRRGRLNLLVTRREIVAAALLGLGIESPVLVNQIADTYAHEREEVIQPFPGAIDTLRYLQQQGVRLALLTNGTADEQRGKINKFDLAPFFDCILIEGEFGVGKPDERVYRFALEQLDVKPEETWMIGDNLEWEVAMPQRLGIFGIWVDFADTGLPEFSLVHPDRIIRTLANLI